MQRGGHLRLRGWKTSGVGTLRRGKGGMGSRLVEDQSRYHLMKSTVGSRMKKKGENRTRSVRLPTADGKGEFMTTLSKWREFTLVQGTGISEQRHSIGGKRGSDAHRKGPPQTKPPLGE